MAWPEDPAVTPRWLPADSSAVSWEMAARQDLLTMPNRAIPSSWQPARALVVEESSSSLGSCSGAAGAGLDKDGNNPSNLHPSAFLGPAEPHPHLDRGDEPLWGKAG